MPVRHTAEITFTKSLPWKLDGQIGTYTTIRLRFPDKGGRFALLQAEFEDISARMREFGPETLIIEGFWRSLWMSREARDRKRREQVLSCMHHLALKRLLGLHPPDEGIEIEKPWGSCNFEPVILKWAAEDLAAALQIGKHFRVRLLLRS